MHGSAGSRFINATDGFPLAADVFVGDGPPRAAIVIAPATGVPRQLYRRFAGYLAEKGFAVVTFDYRGIGGSRPGSLHGFHATASDWAVKDLAAVIRAHRDGFPGVPVIVVAHSIGGQLLGIAAAREPVDGAVFAGAQSAYWKYWSGLGRLRVLVWWYLVVPWLASAFGYLPMRFLGGESLPKGVALEWAQWGRHPDYLLSSRLAQEEHGHERFDRPIRAWLTSDDGFAPRAAAEALLRYYARAECELRLVTPRELGLPRIGHFGYFRKDPGTTLWPRMLADVEELVARAG